MGESCLSGCATARPRHCPSVRRCPKPTLSRRTSSPVSDQAPVAGRARPKRRICQFRADAPASWPGRATRAASNPRRCRPHWSRPGGLSPPSEKPQPWNPSPVASPASLAPSRPRIDLVPVIGSLDLDRTALNGVELVLAQEGAPLRSRRDQMHGVDDASGSIPGHAINAELSDLLSERSALRFCRGLLVRGGSSSKRVARDLVVAHNARLRPFGEPEPAERWPRPRPLAISYAWRRVGPLACGSQIGWPELAMAAAARASRTAPVARLVCPVHHNDPTRVSMYHTVLLVDDDVVPLCRTPPPRLRPRRPESRRPPRTALASRGRPRRRTPRADPNAAVSHRPPVGRSERRAMKLTHIHPGDIVRVDDGLPTTPSSSRASAPACVSACSGASARRARSLPHGSSTSGATPRWHRATTGSEHRRCSSQTRCAGGGGRSRTRRRAPGSLG